MIFTVWISGGQIIDIRVTTHRNSSEAFKCHYIRGPCSVLSWRGVGVGVGGVKRVIGGLEYHLTADWPQATCPLLWFRGVEEESRLDVSLKILTADCFSCRAQGGLKLSFHFTGHPAGGVASGNTQKGFCIPENTWLCQLKNSEEIDGDLNKWFDHSEHPWRPHSLSCWILS